MQTGTPIPLLPQFMTDIPSINYQDIEKKSILFQGFFFLVANKMIRGKDVRIYVLFEKWVLTDLPVSNILINISEHREINFYKYFIK